MLGVYKKWGTNQNVGISIAYELIEIEQKKTPFEAKKVFKYAREMLELVLSMNVKKLKEQLEPSQFLYVLRFVAGLLKEHDAESEFMETFGKFIAHQNQANFIDSKQLSGIVWEVLPLISNEKMRDILFYDIVRELEQLDVKTELEKYLRTKDDQITCLPAYTYFRIKRQMFWDDWSSHLRVLNLIVNKSKTYIDSKYFPALPFYVAEFMNILRAVQDQFPTLGVDVSSSNVDSNFAKILESNNIQPAKNNDPLVKSLELLTDDFQDSTVIYYLRNFEASPDQAFEIPKRVLLRKILTSDISEYVIKDLCKLCKKWIVEAQKESQLLRFEALVFLLDVEDFADMNAMSPSDLKTILEKAANFQIDSDKLQLVELEIIWKGLVFSQAETILAVKQSYEEILESDSFLRCQSEPFLERRILILKNRLYLLRILCEKDPSNFPTIAEEF